MEVAVSLYTNQYVSTKKRDAYYYGVIDDDDESTYNLSVVPMVTKGKAIIGKETIKIEKHCTNDTKKFFQMKLSILSSKLPPKTPTKTHT